MSPYRMSKIESAVRVAIAFNEAFNRHDVEAMVQLVDDDCIVESFHPGPDGGVFTGKDKVTQYWRDFFDKSPRAHIEIEDVFGLGKRCIMLWKYSWTGETGEENHVRGADIFRIVDDRICEQRSYAKR